MDQLPEMRRSLKQIWGYEDFRSEQTEVITSLLAHRDSLVILATGGGKSLCFQLPAIMQQGLTIVISPLLSLMANHIQDLQKKNLPAAMINSSMSLSDRQKTLKIFAKLRLIYLSPETLFSPPVWKQLCQPELIINGLILDEAHCLVQWGEGFRPDYRRLGAVRLALSQHKSPEHNRIAIAAFTATADLQAQSQLIKCLHLESPQKVISSPLRANISLNVAIAWTAAGRKSQALKFIRSFPSQSGLVYIRSRRAAEELAAWLQGEGMPTTAYHAGLPAQERKAIELSWLSGKTSFVIATSAFGMGIDKSNVRWVLHFQTPLILSEYIQEVGRAGRDGKLAKALMLVSEPTGFLDGSDRQRQDFFLQSLLQQQQTTQRLIAKLPRRGNYGEVIKQFPDAPSALGLLHSEGQLRWLTPFEYQITCAANYQLSPIETLALDQMQNFISTKDCRWAFLIRAYGFTQEAEKLRCGICDRCIAKGYRRNLP